MNGIEILNSKPPVIGSRCCRASYGVLGDALYDPKWLGHKSAEVYVHPVSKLKYARRQVQWLIKKVSQVVRNAGVGVTDRNRGNP